MMLQCEPNRELIEGVHDTVYLQLHAWTPSRCCAIIDLQNTVDRLAHCGEAIAACHDLVLPRIQRIKTQVNIRQARFDHGV